MSKKNRRHKDNFETIEINIPDGTLTESFKKFIENDSSNKNIICFLAVQNAKYIAKTAQIKEFSKEEKEELYEFYAFFMENYGEKTEDARLTEWWGREPFVLRLADELYNEDCERADTEFMETVPLSVKNEAMKLCEKLFAIRKNKKFSCTTSNDLWEINIQRTIPKKYLQDAKDTLVTSIAKIIALEGAMVVRVFNTGDSPSQMFAIRGNGTTWESVSKEEMKAADLEAQKNSGDFEIMEYTELEKI